MTVWFVTGGARSGKSRYAERLAASAGRASDTPVCFIATGRPFDDEMSDRIRKHQATRPKDWTTLEVPVDVDRVLIEQSYDVYVIDCLTLLLNNWMYDLAIQEDAFLTRVRALVDALQSVRGTCIVVSNEIGLGIVPADAESRRYRDWLGWLNQAVAAAAEHVYLVVSGVAVDILALPGAAQVRDE